MYYFDDKDFYQNDLPSISIFRQARSNPLGVRFSKYKDYLFYICLERGGEAGEKSE